MAHVAEEDKTTTLIQGTCSNYKSKAVLINESAIGTCITARSVPCFDAKEYSTIV
ncbi:MAG: hypothetical protein J6W19_00115 [Prevotella sp.]|nr:hypothetical protein [Prevotella sp.]